MRPGTFDPRELDIEVAERGFVVGVSKIGDAIGTGSGERADISRAVRSIRISRARGVADDLFIKSAPPTCTIGLIFTDIVPTLKSRDLVISYRGQQLYRGNITVSSRSATVDPDVRGGKRWDVAMQSADLNFGSRKLTLSAFTTETTMSAGLLERVPTITSVVVSSSVIHRARTFRMPAGTAWGTDTTDLATFLESIGRTLSCIVEIDQRVLTLRGYDDGITWQVGDQPNDDPSYSSVQIDEDTSYPTGIRLTALGSSAPAVTPDLYSASHYEAGVQRNDKDLTVAVPEDASAVQAVLNTLPSFVSLPESVRSVTIPFSEQLDLSDTPTRMRVWLDGQLWEAAIVGLSHNITPDAERHHSKWTITVTLGPLYLLTREGTNVAPVTELTVVGETITWVDTPGVAMFVVDYRTDGRWSQYPTDGTGSTFIEPGNGVYDLSSLPPATYQVTVWARDSASRYSEARTTELVVV